MYNLEEYKNKVNNSIIQIENYNDREDIKWTYEDSKEYIIYDYSYKIQICELIACSRYLLNKK